VQGYGPGNWPAPPGTTPVCADSSMMVERPEPGTSHGLRPGIGPRAGTLDQRLATGPGATSDGDRCLATGPKTGTSGQASCVGEPRRCSWP
jgi:hypothetical protein